MLPGYRPSAALKVRPDILRDARSDIDHIDEVIIVFWRQRVAGVTGYVWVPSTKPEARPYVFAAKRAAKITRR